MIENTIPKSLMLFTLRESKAHTVKGKASMSTYEDRLKTVEFDLRLFKTETIKAYSDMAYEIVIVKGLGEDSIKRLSALNNTVEKRFDAVNERLDAVDSRLDRVETMLAQILERLPKPTE